MSARAAATVRSPRYSPISAGEQVQHAVVAHRVGRQRRLEGPDPALPVDERARLLLVRGDRQHDVGDLGDGALAHLERDDERARQRVHAARRARAGRPGRRRRPRDRPAGPRRRRRSSRRCRDRRCSGSPIDAPGLADLGAGGGLGDRAATGQQARAARRSPARPARRPGAGPRPAGPRVRRPGRPPPTARRARRPAARRPARAPAHRPGPRPRRRHPGGCRRGSRRPAPPGPRPRCRAPTGSACRPPCPGRGWRTAPPAYTAVLFLRNALRRRRNTIGDSSSGSNPTSTTVRRALDVGVGHRVALGAGGHDVAGEELRLLRRVRAGAEVDVVGAAARPGRTCCRRRRPRR